MEHEISVSREKTGLGHREAAGLVKKAIHRALDAEGIDRPCIVNVMLTDDEGIHAVNKEFRNVDRATDVLSFPFNELTPGSFDAEKCEKDMDTGALLLGDMMISLERCAAPGGECGHGSGREIQYRAVHSDRHL